MPEPKIKKRLGCTIPCLAAFVSGLFFYVLSSLPGSSIPEFSVPCFALLAGIIATLILAYLDINHPIIEKDEAAETIIKKERQLGISPGALKNLATFQSERNKCFRITPDLKREISSYQKEHIDLCIDLMANTIQAFYVSLQNSPELSRFIYHEVDGLEDLDKVSRDELINGCDNRLLLLFFADFTKVYKRLGHVFTYRHTEIYPLVYALLGVMQVYNTDITPVRRNDFYIEKARPFLASLSSSRCDDLSGDYEFALTTILEHAGFSQKAKSHIQLIYDFSHLVAIIDQNITEKEQTYLDGFEAFLQNGAIKKVEQKPADESKSLRQLEALTGLERVKQEISSLVSFIKIQQMRREKGMKETPVSYHCVFTGNPGTGKTTVARIIADIYRELGVIKKGQLIETDRAGLVAEYVGQTAVKTNKVIDSAIDGVLFIDEAYSLVPEGPASNDFGREAIATLLKRMEDNRDRLIVILAGYGDEMRRFIESNPGLESRFNRYIHFDDYTPEQLAEIFRAMAADNDYTLDPSALERLNQITTGLVASKDRHFGNARTMRNLFERAIANQATRLARSTDPAYLTPTSLRTLSAPDLPSPNH